MWEVSTRLAVEVVEAKGVSLGVGVEDMITTAQKAPWTDGGCGDFAIVNTPHSLRTDCTAKSTVMWGPRVRKCEVRLVPGLVLVRLLI